MSGSRLLFVLFLMVSCDKDETPSAFPVRNPNAVTTNPPSTGPYYHTVRSAVSDDGLVWKEERTADLVLHGSVPAAVELDDGTRIAYFVDFSSGNPERLGCVVSHDGGVTYTWGNCSLEGLTSVKAVDFAPFKMPDGSVRLYFYASGNDVGSTALHLVDAASGNGISFARISTVFSYNGLVDPDVFWNGKEWLMHVFSLSDGATVRATSADGMSFVYKDVLQPANIGVTKPVQLDDGSFRMYGFPQGPGNQVRFVSLRSADGYLWTQEGGDRLTAPAGYDITDPYVVRLKNGKWWMVYKRSQNGK